MFKIIMKIFLLKNSFNNKCKIINVANKLEDKVFLLLIFYSYMYQTLLLEYLQLQRNYFAKLLRIQPCLSFVCLFV